MFFIFVVLFGWPSPAPRKNPRYHAYIHMTHEEKKKNVAVQLSSRQTFDEIDDLFMDMGDMKPGTTLRPPGGVLDAVDAPRPPRPGSMPINGMRGGRGSAGAPGGREGGGQAIDRAAQAGEAIINDLLSSGGGAGGAGAGGGRFSAPNVRARSWCNGCASELRLRACLFFANSGKERERERSTGCVPVCGSALTRFVSVCVAAARCTPV